MADPHDPEILGRLFGDERRANARRVNLVRCWGISFFFGLFLVLGGALGNPAWQGNLREFGVYWTATIALYVASRKLAVVERLSGLSIALIDLPMVFLLQWKQFPTSPNPGAIAGYNLGVYVLLLLLAALSLDARIVYVTAATAAVLEGLLQYLAGISAGAIVATFAIMALAGAACAYGSRRLRRLITELGLDMTKRYAAEQAAERARTELAGLAREMQIASQIQQSILPRSPGAPGFEIAAWVEPAEQVGGDYYDVRAVEDGCWIGIGDVTGHGINAGLVMMMLQTAIATAIGEGGADPASVLVQVNRVLYDNIRHRLGARDHVTCSLLRLYADGRVLVAGRHEPLLVWRAADHRCEEIDVAGTWLGLARDIARATSVATHTLAPGDVLVLHTDGLVEAADATGTRFELPRLVDLVTATLPAPPASLVAAVRERATAWTTARTDDITLVAIRYLG